MPDPFGAIKGAFSSFAGFINDNLNNYALYQRYGPDYRNLIANKVAGDKLAELTAKERLRTLRAQRGSAELNLELDKETQDEKIAIAEANQRKAEAQAGTAGFGVIESAADLNARGAGITREEFEDIAPGVPGVAQDISSRLGGEEFKVVEEKRQIDAIRKKEEFEEKQKSERLLQREREARQDLILAQTGNVNARTELVNRQRFELEEKFAGRGPKKSVTGLADDWGNTPTEREDMMLSLANRYYRNNPEEGPEFEFVDDDGNVTGVQKVDGGLVRIEDMSDVPPEVQQRLRLALDAMNQDFVTQRQGRIQKQETEQEAQGGFTVQEGNSGRVFRGADPELNAKIKKAFAAGEELTPFELEYLEQLQAWEARQ